ncbi:AAA family ATPase [Grimontia hollisae]|uniref:AAA family ATPase n=1 Tax=Grimontia hollisae TaxID=673 RepID=UPI0018EF2D9B|nr:ATP-binding protein [Grimontia hollisae]
MSYIYSYQFNNERIPLLIDNMVDEGKNVFTVLIGENGTGKSRLLADMASKFTSKDNYYNHRSDSSRVIAASTSPFDIFPRSYGRNSRRGNYRYIGMKRSGPMTSSPLSLMSSAMLGILEKHINGESYDDLFHVFSALGFRPSLSLNYRSDFKFEKKIGIFDDNLNSLEKKLGLGIKHPYINYINRNMTNPEDEEVVVHSFEVIRDFGFDFSSFSISFDLTSNEFHIKGKESHIELKKSIYTLIKHGFIRLLDVKLDKLDTGTFSLRRASSGEQCMLLLMLGIAGHISNNSIVLIDEPEISLHPKWQESFMPLLMKVFNRYKSCQFIIASHSPQIVSNATSHNCFVTSISRNEIYEVSYFSNKSSDFQLAELFNAPGNKNEYITRLCFGLLSRVKANRIVNDVDLESLNKILSFTSILDNNDPLLDLIVSVKEVVDFYASN